MTSFFFVIVSIVAFCIETLPSMQMNITRTCGTNASATTKEAMTSYKEFEYVDYVCTAFFSVEFIVRVVFAPNKTRFFCSIMNIIDILALLPLYVQVCNYNADWVLYYSTDGGPLFIGGNACHYHYWHNCIINSK